jgi:replicative DNA helicase Mcm
LSFETKLGGNKDFWEKFRERYLDVEVQKAIDDAELDKETIEIPINYSYFLAFDDYFKEWVEKNSFLAMEQLSDYLRRNTTIKVPIKCRIIKTEKHLSVEIGDVREKHFNTLISVDGMIKKVGEARGRIEVGAFKCARCPTIVKLEQDGFQLSTPLECYKEQDGCGRTPPSTKFTFLPEESKYHDIQRIEIQESPDSLRNGRQPHSLNCYITHDLVGTLLPGDRVTLNGVMELERSTDKKATGLVDKRLHIMSFEKKQSSYDDIEITEEDKEKILALSQDIGIYDLLTRSIAPSIQGYDDVKESMLLQQFGGVTKIMDDGRRLRGDIHILLTGDPGIAKSELGKYQTCISPRSVYASGKGSSSAGLTAAAVKDVDFLGEGGKWTLEAGAMVRASGGLLIADEMDKMDKLDRQSLHGGMEQGEIHIQKAGIDATLKTECSVLGIANPKYGRFDDSACEALVEQINLEPALLSRFDLIYILLDKADSKKDELISTKVLDNHSRCSMSQNTLDKDFFRKYIAEAKKVNPVLTDEAKEIIQQNYLLIRRKANLSKSMSITPRQLDGYIRLAEASARVRLSREVTIDDARRAVRLVQSCLNRIAPDGDIDVIMTGTRRGERDKIQMIKDVLSQGLNQTMRESDLKIKLEEKGMKPTEIDGLLEKMRSNGDLLKPRINSWALIT